MKYFNVQVWPLPSGMRAMMSITSVDVTEEDVKLALAMKGVVAGIRTDTIKEAIEKARGTGEPQHNILAAEAEIASPRLLMGGREFAVTGDSIREFGRRFRSIGAIIENAKVGKPEVDIPEGLFVKKGDIFCIEEFPRQGRDIFGRPLRSSRPVGPALICGATISVIRLDDRMEYRATTSGYLVASTSGEFGISDAIFVSDDRMELYFLAAPVWHDADALLDFFYDAAFSQGAGMVVRQVVIPDRGELSAVVSSGKASRIVIRRGKPAIPGRDARVDIIVTVPIAPVEKEDGSVDYKELSHFHQIQEGAVIAEKILSIPSTPGETVLGELLPAKPPNDVYFRAGRNIIEREENGKTVYIAGCTGVLKLNDCSAEIAEVLHIAGDVGPETGNIRSDKDVVISGNVVGGYMVDCGGNLTIGGTVENGARIVCKKNLTVRSGVLGEKTEVAAGGNGDIHFVQEAAVRVDGDLRVRKYIYNARTLAGGRLSVDGSGVEGGERGCILGGETVAMESMSVASAGCEGEVTKLCCGVDPEALRVVSVMKAKMAALNKTAAGIRDKIRIDLDSPGARDKLKALPEREKARIKSLLTELKSVVQEQQSYSEKLPLVGKKALTERPEACRITVKKYLIPRVMIRIGSYTKIEQEKISGVTYRCLNDDGIVRL